MIPLRSVKSDFFDITMVPEVGAITSDCFEIFIWQVGMIHTENIMGAVNYKCLIGFHGQFKYAWGK